MSAWPVSFSAQLPISHSGRLLPPPSTISHIFMAGGERKPAHEGFVFYLFLFSHRRPGANMRLASYAGYPTNRSMRQLSILLLLLASPLPAQQFSPELYAGLRWRNIGPYRGGRT